MENARSQTQELGSLDDIGSLHQLGPPGLQRTRALKYLSNHLDSVDRLLACAAVGRYFLVNFTLEESS